ncbi:MAG: hypothetical protein K0U59_09680 [Gammaproteobacteria bacterium]|nr:hypothetical protein [Gammaproteobacteria bacterium]
MIKRTGKHIVLLSVMSIVACSEPAEKQMDEIIISAEPKTQRESKEARQPQKLPGRSRSVWVEQAKGNRQCEGGGLNLQQSAHRLITSGVKVLESRCGIHTAAAYPSVCGGATGDMLLHRIAAVHLDAALELGFNPAQPGKFQFGKCSENEVWAITP